MHSPCSVRDVKKVLGRSDVRVLACCVLHNLESDAYEAYAVVSAGGGREVEVGGWPVFLLHPGAPLSEHILTCRLGDIFLCYQVVSIDGGPILSEAGGQHLYREMRKQGETRGTPRGYGAARESSR
jgi:hypothetical protein